MTVLDTHTTHPQARAFDRPLTARERRIIDDITRREFVIGGTALAALIAAGCGDGGDTSTPEVTTRLVTDDAGREVEIPVAPQRTVCISIETSSPLVSLGHVPAGVVHTFGDASDLARAGGTPGDLSQVANLGVGGEPNFEAIAELRPDLILARVNEVGGDRTIELLAEIAPTVLVDPRAADPDQPQRFLADAVGLADAFDELRSRYEARVEEVRDAFPGVFDQLEYTWFDSYSPAAGNYLYESIASPADQVLVDLGATRSRAMSDAVVGQDNLEVSLEQLAAFDADVVFISTVDDAPVDPSVLEVLANTHAARNDQVFQVNGNVWPFTLLHNQLLVLDDIERFFAGRDIDASGEF